MRLTSTGFGPYKDRTVIDMDRLGRGGLYLVTGDTGAGKTFIFDAITFALFGEMSGGSRDSRGIRSQYADENTPTEAELVFEYRGETYTVKRNPEYTRRRKRGEGFTTESANAELYFPGGSVISGAGKVTAAVKDLLGIDKSQFCSIVMIAQGEFREVLNASTDQRQLLFRKLFDTEPYNRLSEELRKMSRDVSASFDDKKKEIRMALSGAACRFDDKLSEELRSVNNSEDGDASIDQMLDILGRISERGAVIERDTRRALESADEEFSKAQKAGMIIENAKENKNKLDSAIAELEILADEVKRAEAALDEANMSKPEIEKLGAELAVISGGMETYDRLEVIKNELAAAKKAIEDNNKKLEAALSKRNDSKERIEALEAEAAASKNAGEDLIRIKAEIERNSVSTNALTELKKDIESVRNMSKELEKKQTELEELIKKAEALEADHSEAASAYLREQAGILAGSLEMGKPCPVCGSIEHPCPARLSEAAPSAEDVETKQKLASKARQKAADKSGEAQTVKGSLQTITTKAKEAAKNVTGTDELDTAYAYANEELVRLTESLERLKSDEKETEEKLRIAASAEKKRTEAQKSYDEAEKESSELGKEAVRLEESARGIEKRLDDIKKGLRFEGKAEALHYSSELEASIEKKKDIIEAAAKRSADAQSALKACEARIEELGRLPHDYDPDEEKRITAAIAEASETKEALTQDLINISSDTDSVKKALDAVKTGASRLDAIRREHESIDSLMRTASGSLAGKDRITLEAFVQTMYFERVLRRANLRLRMISDGRYEFVRGTESKDKRSHNGLDLAVVDHYSGSERPVSTLSGGESFMASLSLALGLSDEVQSSAGGIRLDTMFIDEGFGSLDSSTLEKAIAALTSLADEDRLIGIISHVDALKPRINNQIVVTKGRGSGSRAEITL